MLFVTNATVCKLIVTVVARKTPAALKPVAFPHIFYIKTTSLFLDGAASAMM
jgi:hypothetical protein